MTRRTNKATQGVQGPRSKVQGLPSFADTTYLPLEYVQGDGAGPRHVPAAIRAELAAHDEMGGPRLMRIRRRTLYAVDDRGMAQWWEFRVSHSHLQPAPCRTSASASASALLGALPLGAPLAFLPIVAALSPLPQPPHWATGPLGHNSQVAQMAEMARTETHGDNKGHDRKLLCPDIFRNFEPKTSLDPRF